MTARERFDAAFTRPNLTGTPSEVPFAPLYMGLYRAPHARRLYLEALRERLTQDNPWSPSDEEQLDFLVAVHQRTLGIFKVEHDWLDISSGTPFPLFSRGTAHRCGERVWWTTPDGREHEVLLEVSPARDVWESMQPPESPEEIDRCIPLSSQTPQPDSWFHRFTERIAAQYRHRQCLVGSMGTPYWACYGLFGFARLMQNIVDAPKLVQYAAERFLRRAEDIVRYYRSIRCDCVFIEECLSSADLISPRAYDECVFPTTRAVLDTIRKHGMRSVFYMCGDVMPLIDRVVELPFDALAVEESKKGFRIDIAEVRRILGTERTLFGNLDVCLVRDGTSDRIAGEVRRQVDAAGRDGHFVVSNGSPFTLDTPPEKIDMITEATRNLCHRSG